MTRESCYTIPAEMPPGTFEIHLRGEIDLARKPELHQIIAAYARSLAGNVVVDLGRVTFFDVTGLALLVDLHREALVRGSHLVLRHVPSMPRRVIQVAGMGHLLPEGPPAPGPALEGLLAPEPSPGAS
jgi:anti-anti-sigma factor